MNLSGTVTTIVVGFALILWGLSPSPPTHADVAAVRAEVAVELDDVRRELAEARQSLEVGMHSRCVFWLEESPGSMDLRDEVALSCRPSCLVEWRNP
jgi:hypothetical protein